MELVTSYDMYALIVTCPTLVILFCYNNSWTYILYTLVKSNVEILYFTGPGRSGWEKWFSGIYSHISKYIMFIQKKKKKKSFFYIRYRTLYYLFWHTLNHSRHSRSSDNHACQHDRFCFLFFGSKNHHTHSHVHSLTHKTRRHQRHNSF